MCESCEAQLIAGPEDPNLSRRALLVAAAAGVGTALAAPGTAAASGGRHDDADLIFYNGPVFDGRRRLSGQAVAVTDGRIAAVGHTKQVMRLAGRRTRRIDLNRRTLVPGFIDSHNHQLNGALSRPNVVLFDARSIADVLAAIGDRVAATQAGVWVVAQSRWHEGLLAENRLPTRHDLDPVSPDNPVYIPRGGHVAAVNSAALALAGITRETPDPPGGKIVRDGNGEPTGVLLERAKDAASRLLPPPPAIGEQRRLLREQIADHHALGLTSITDPGLNSSQIGLYADLRAAGELAIRSHVLWRVFGLADIDVAADAFRPRQGDDMFRFDGLKYSADGGVEGAFLHEPYELVPGEQTDPEYRGLMILPPGGLAELEAMYVRAARHGFQFQTHIVGDATLDTLIDILWRVNDRRRLAQLRWPLVHIFHPTERALRLARRMKLCTTVQNQPFLLGANQVKWWGPTRAARAIPVREILDAGLTAVGGGTDGPNTSGTSNPLDSIWWMVTRGTLTAGVLGPEQAISLDEALSVYTTGSAFTQFADHKIGAIRRGMLADLAVLETDIHRIDPDDLRAVKVDMTVLDGEVVYERA